VRLHQDMRKTVVFIGRRLIDGTFDSIGTAFFLAHRGLAHLVTAKHIALPLGDDPFDIRLNTPDGQSGTLHVDGGLGHHMDWFFHEDPDVDVAIAPFRFDGKPDEIEYKFLPSEMILDKEGVDENRVGIGDLTYTVGLYRLLPGRNRNLPIVHTGNVAMLPSSTERIPVEDWETEGQTRYIEGFLIESQTLQGLSGSPVFVRRTIELTFQDTKITVLAPNRDLVLLGVMQGAWDAKPDEALSISTGRRLSVPVGMSVVTPAERILTILENPKLMAIQDDALAKRRPRASLASVPVNDPLGNDGNPSHRQDFSRLLGAAARKPKQDE
jgi:hypothetical protein